MALAKQYEQLAEKHCCTEGGYFAIERVSEGHWEYINDQVRFMTGGTMIRVTNFGIIKQLIRFRNMFW